MDLLVKRGALHETRRQHEPPPALAGGEARLRVDAFALTANNITYGVFGDAMGYWNFFPAPEGWGRIPVWGFADVVESTVAGVAEGDRFYGYFPMSHELVVQPTHVGERGFTDGAPHRSAMAATYNQYSRTTADPDYDPAHEDAQMLLRPLILTGFLLDDFVDDNDRFGASTVVLTSASSKTAAGAAFFLAEREGLEVIGLTSPANRSFVEGLGVYDRVLGYDEVGALPTGAGSAVFIDVAGSADARAAVHRHYGDDLARSIMVGGTHWDEPASAEAAGPLPGPAPALFFAPDQIAKRAAEWGADGFASRVSAAWGRAVAWSDGWLQVEHGRGPDAVEETYAAVLAGRTPPSTGHVLSMWS